MARHARSVRNGSQTLLLDHYLEILAHKPGALAGATALVQARRAGCGALVTAGGRIGSVPARIPFEQYEYHTAWERPGGLANRSGAGDLDLLVYSARKWVRLALGGNPTVLIPLFVPADEIVSATDAGRELRENAHRIASRRAADRFLGYLVSQRRAMTGEIGAHTNRPELVVRFGYDCKFAMHALRLGIQGKEYLRTGRITLPIPEPDLAALREVRRGEWDLPAVLEWTTRLEADLHGLADTSPLPAESDVDWVNNWLHRSYTRFWAQQAGSDAASEEDR